MHGRDGSIKLRKVLQLAAWNVRTMRTNGKLEIIEREMMRLGISCLGLSETRWTGVGHFLSDAGSTVIYSGAEEHKHGVGLILNGSTAKAMMGYNPIRDRILTVRLAAEP